MVDPGFADAEPVGDLLGIGEDVPIDVRPITGGVRLRTPNRPSEGKSRAYRMTLAARWRRRAAGRKRKAARPAIRNRNPIAGRKKVCALMPASRMLSEGLAGE